MADESKRPAPNTIHWLSFLKAVYSFHALLAPIILRQFFCEQLRQIKPNKFAARNSYICHRKTYCSRPAPTLPWIPWRSKYARLYLSVSKQFESIDLRAFSWRALMSLWSMTLSGQVLANQALCHRLDTFPIPQLSSLLVPLFAAGELFENPRHSLQ
jgi:hypothetical protein